MIVKKTKGISIMILSRSELREKAMIILYQIDICEERKMEYDIDYLIKANLEVDNEFVKEIVYGVTTYKDTLDEMADKHMTNWNIKRIDKTGASILRIALFEITYTDTPEVVVINEAVELAKKYSDDAVRKIVNAVLDKVIKE